MPLYITNFSSLWKENRCAPALIDDLTIDEIFASSQVRDYLEGGVDELLVIVEEHANGINQASIYNTHQELVELTGEWVKVDSRWLEDAECSLESLVEYYDGDLVFTVFFDRPNYWPRLVPSGEEGSLVPLKFNRARPFEDSE